MKLTEILNSTHIQLDEVATSKKQVLEVIAKNAVQATKCEQQIVFDALVERERLGTTGIGKGVAIPHARLAGLTDLYCTFLRVKPVDFESVDSKPVDLIFCLLVPEESGADHLKALARISKLLRNEDVCASLRDAKNEQEILEIIGKADNED
jgi:PTS system nitrogen regulatory IIA component